MKYLKGLRFWLVLCLGAIIVGVGSYYGIKSIAFRPLIEPDDDGKTILTKFLKALGGDDRTLSLKTGYIRYHAKVGIVPMMKDTESIVEDTFDFPGRFKRVVRVTGPVQDLKMSFVVKDGKGWKKLGDGDPEPMETFKIGDKEHELAMFWNVAPLLEGNVQLTRVGEEKVGEHQTVIVHASGEAPYASYLYFDKKNALLIKSKRQIPHEAVANIWAKAPLPVDQMKKLVAGEHRDKLMTMEVFLSNYQDLQGRLVPTTIKCYQDGEPFMDVTLKEVRFLEKIDASEFALP